SLIRGSSLPKAIPAPKPTFLRSGSFRNWRAPSALLEHRLELSDPRSDQIAVHGPKILGQQLSAGALLNRGQALQLDFEGKGRGQQVGYYFLDCIGRSLFPAFSGRFEPGADEHRFDGGAAQMLALLGNQGSERRKRDVPPRLLANHLEQL